MRTITKGPCPAILAANAAAWLAEWLADPTNDTKRHRYRHKDIKDSLIEETSGKCVYCESKLGAVHPGETEHKIPSSKVPQLHFEWTNLTRACTECNRRKNAFYRALDGFIDPYTDEVESLFEHQGPVVFAKKGDPRANTALRTLQLNGREALIMAKTEVLTQLRDAVERYWNEGNATLKEVLRLELVARSDPGRPYSAMVKQTLITAKVLPAQSEVAAATD